jgi:hypothetical protein
MKTQLQVSTHFLLAALFLLQSVCSPAHSASDEVPDYTGTGVALRTGQIVVVRHGEQHGAILAIDQASEERGRFVQYCWWYRPDALRFTESGTATGCAASSESDPGEQPSVEFGPISLEWSMGGDGLGWIYFGPPNQWSEEYELAHTATGDIAQVDPSVLTFHRYDPSYVVRPGR